VKFDAHPTGLLVPHIILVFRGGIYRRRCTTLSHYTQLPTAYSPPLWRIHAASGYWCETRYEVKSSFIQTTFDTNAEGFTRA